jgi:dTDP-4-dehydrorhamnose 3,5-epimerase
MFEFKKTPIDGLHLVSPKVHRDHRGQLIKKFHKTTFENNSIKTDISEEIIQISDFGVMRGLHFQTKHPQSKLINVCNGRILDVVVDLRFGSKTYGKHYSVELSDSNNLMLYIPEGFAHGYLVLEDKTIVSYFCSSEHEPDFDSGILYNDPELEIEWPNIGVEYIISEKDISLPLFRDFKGFMSGSELVK